MTELNSHVAFSLPVADRLPVHHSPASTALLLATLASLVTTVYAASAKKPAPWHRLLFWCGALATAIFASLLPPSATWNQSIALGVFFFCALTVSAYMYTPFIQIRGKTYTYFKQAGGSTDTNQNYRRGAANENGVLISSPKLWWTLAFGILLCSFNIFTFAIDHQGARPALVSVIAIFIFAAAFGYIDGSSYFDVARGQRMQFILITITTAILFPAVYLFLYYAAKKLANNRGATTPNR